MTTFAVALLSASGPATGSTPADAMVVAQWNQIAQAETIPLRPTAHGQSRGMAMVAGAMYDAVNAIDRGHASYLLDLDTVGDEGSEGAAAATAAYRTLLSITPVARHPGLEMSYASTLSTLLLTQDPVAVQQGVEIGEAAAAAMIDAREDDGFLDPFTPTIGTGAGDWRPLGWPAAPVYDPDGWVGELEPFLMESQSQFRTEGPNDLTSNRYTREFNEVKKLGAVNSTKRTADQTAAAVFWQAAPIALYNRLARDLAVQFGLDAADQSRLHGMINLAAADGAIACWNDKYHWSFWRPRAAIREADTDGNPETVADPTWEPLFTPSTATTPPLNTPPFPDHPSGHGCVSGAVLNSMTDFFGTSKIEITIVSSRMLNGVAIPPRTFPTFNHALREVIDARVWGGIHFRTADVVGAEVGEKVARHLNRHYFEPVD